MGEECFRAHQSQSRFFSRCLTADCLQENNVSSTSVRRAVKRGLSIKYFVADGVLEHIKAQKLYQE